MLPILRSITVTKSDTLNLAGAWGAAVSEAIFTFTGMAGLLPIAVLICWGRVLIARHRLGRPAWRALAALAAPILALPALAASPASGWLAAGAGGIGGTLLVAWASRTTGIPVQVVESYALALLLPALVALAFATALPWPDVRKAGRFVRVVAGALWQQQHRIGARQSGIRETAAIDDARETAPEFPIPKGSPFQTGHQKEAPNRNRWEERPEEAQPKRANEPGQVPGSPASTAPSSFRPVNSWSVSMPRCAGKSTRAS